MYMKIPSRFVNIATKLYSNVIYSAQQKFTNSQFHFLETRLLVTRGYCFLNPTQMVHQKYKKLEEMEFNEMLKDPKYMVLYEKYKLEIEYMKYTTAMVPSKLTPYDWIYLLKSSSKGQRRAYLQFRFKVEIKKHKTLEEKNLKKEQRNTIQTEEGLHDDDDDNPYRLFKSSMFFRIREQTMNNFQNKKLIEAIMFEPTIVFDFSLEKNMTLGETQNCAKQLLLSFSANRAHSQPFNLHFCNVNLKGKLIQMLHKSIPQLHETHFPLNISSKSYLDIYNKKKLIYLTPNSRRIMRSFDPTHTYIIGAMVDKVKPYPITLIKSQQEGIQTQRLPLGEVLNWGVGSGKSLPLNQVLSILLDLRVTNNWQIALRNNIPERKMKYGAEHEQIKRKTCKKKILDSLSICKE